MASQLKQRRRPSGLPLALLGYMSERLKHVFETEYPGSSSLCMSYSYKRPDVHLLSSLEYEPNANVTLMVSISWKALQLGGNGIAGEA